MSRNNIICYFMKFRTQLFCAQLEQLQNLCHKYRLQDIFPKSSNCIQNIPEHVKATKKIKLENFHEGNNIFFYILKKVDIMLIIQKSKTFLNLKKKAVDKSPEIYSQHIFLMIFVSLTFFETHIFILCRYHILHIIKMH